MTRITEVPVTPDDVVTILAKTAVLSVTEWPHLNQVRRITLIDNGKHYRIDVSEFVELKEAE